MKPGAEIRVYHLVRPEGPAGGGGGAGGQETAARAVPEVFLTRLLATKGKSDDDHPDMFLIGSANWYVDALLYAFDVKTTLFVFIYCRAGANIFHLVLANGKI